MKNPFSLIDEDYVEPLKLSPRNIQQPRSSIIKSSALPFKPYEIKHQPKKKLQQKTIKQTKINTNTNNNSKIIADDSHKNEQQIQKSIQNNNSKNQASSVFSQQSKQLSFQESDQFQQKQYFLSKKTRTVEYKLDQHGDPPLLYDIGLDTQIIKDKIKLVLKIGSPDYDMIRNPDLSGPIIIAFTFGFLLMLSGQLRFADIYAIFIFGNGFLFFLFNFMSKAGLISLYSTMSILGYSLLPMLFLGAIKIFTKLNSPKGILISFLIALWSSAAAGNFISALVRGKKNRKLLVIYPLFLFYLTFAMIVIF